MAVTITDPTPGETLTGISPITATFTGTRFEVATVTFDGIQMGSDSTQPITFSVDTTQLQNGTYSLVVAVRYRTTGGARRWQKASVPVTVSNEGEDMKLTLTTDSSPVSGTITITATATPATQASQITRVDFYVDNVFQSRDTSSPYTFSWDTSLVQDGMHQVKAVAFYGRNKAAGDTIDVQVQNIPIPPPPPVPQAVPVNTALPTIDDTTPQESQTITVSPGVWTNSPTFYTYQWERAGSAISSATGRSYTCAAADVGQTLSCVVSAFNEVGPSAPAETEATSAVTALSPAVPVLVATPMITGTPQVGSTLQASNGSWTNQPTSYTRQWKRAAPTPITSSINPGDTILVGQTWTVRTAPDASLVEFYIDGNQIGTETVEPFTVVIPSLSNGAHALGIAATIPGVDGGARVIYTSPGEEIGTFASVTVAASNPVYNGAGTAISGATNQTYVATTADVGFSLRVVTTAVNATGSSIPEQSDPTAAVSAVAPPPPPDNAYWSENFDTGASPPSGWSLERSAFPTSPSSPYTGVTASFLADPFGGGNGQVVRFRDVFDATLPINYSQRQLISYYRQISNSFSGMNQGQNRETWYRTKFAFPSGTKFSSGMWHFIQEWHHDSNTWGGGGSPGLNIYGNYPLNNNGSPDPRLAVVWRHGSALDPSPGSFPGESYWPNSGGGELSSWTPIPIQYDHWYDSVFRVIWSTNASQGLVQWWLDGTLQINRAMQTSVINPNLPYGHAQNFFGIYNYRYHINATSDVYFALTTAGPTAASVSFTVP